MGKNKKAVAGIEVISGTDIQLKGILLKLGSVEVVLTLAAKESLKRQLNNL